MGNYNKLILFKSFNYGYKYYFMDYYLWFCGLFVNKNKLNKICNIYFQWLRLFDVSLIIYIIKIKIININNIIINILVI